MISVDKTLENTLRANFVRLNRSGAAIPPLLALSRLLETQISTQKKGPVPKTGSFAAKPEIIRCFATAAVDIWLRGVHGFLISASLSEASPIWAVVSGYYASHYSIRAMAHLLGYFQLFRQKRIVKLQIQNGVHICTFDSKDANDREHRFYWKVVKNDKHFASDPLFTENLNDQDISDVAHRDRASYADHVQQCPTFRPLQLEEIKKRIDFISKMEFDVPPIPDRRKFPDVLSVQVVAYQRVVRFRQFLDQLLGSSSRFWNVHRNPHLDNRHTRFSVTATSRSAGNVYKQLRPVYSCGRKRGFKNR